MPRLVNLTQNPSKSLGIEKSYKFSVEPTLRLLIEGLTTEKEAIASVECQLNHQIDS